MGTRVIIANFLIFLQMTFLNFASAEETVYTTLSPPQVYSNSEYKLHVFLQPSSSDTSKITFEAELECGSDIFSSGTITLLKTKRGRTGEIVIPTETIQGSSCNLTVRQGENGVNASDQYITVNVGKNDFIFLQTDKPIYKPKEFVLFRVLLMDRHSMPKPSRIDVRVFDSRKNLVKLWLNVDPDEVGLFEGNFELSYQPNMGEWTIEVKTMEIYKGKPTMKKLGFKVDEYVLPTFDVDVELPKFRIISAMQTIPVQIQAKYLYGEGVKGTCTIVVTLSSWFCGTETRQQLETLTDVKIAGTASLDLNLTAHIGNDTSNKAHLEFHVTVKENGTGRTAIDEKVVILYKNALKIRPDVKVTYSRPGLTFPIDFKILDNYEQIVKINGENASIEHNLNGDVEYSQEPFRDGIVHLNLTYNNFESSLNIKVKYKDISYDYYVPERLESEFQNYLIIQAPTSELSPGSVFNIVGETTSHIDSLNVAMVSDGEVILANTTTFPESITKFHIDVTIPSSTKSNAKIFVFTYIDDEYVGDFAELKIVQNNTQQDSNLQISVSQQIVSPGEEVRINITSRENSFVALRGVDEAISLLTSAADLTLEDLTDEFESEKKRTQGGAEGFFELNNSEMLILTNSKQKSEGYVQESDYEPDEQICSVSMSASSIEGTFTRVTSEKFRPRSYFPETWLWSIVSVGPNISRNDLRIKVPDTLTSWVISGYSLKLKSHIEFLPAPLKLTVFKDFFLTLELPYSVVQSETLQLNILIHNYILGNVSLSRKVYLRMHNPNKEFEVEGSNPPAKIVYKTINCEPNSVTPVQVELTPLKHGDLKLLFDAASSNLTDALSQILRVIPRGQKKIQTKSAVITVPKSPHHTEWFSVQLSNIVHASDTVKISFSADIMSSSTENMESLIELPAGCGEQNMLTFGTDIVTMNYLKATKRLTSEIQKKGVRYLELGHQRQLTFRNPDGSFSAFTQPDTTGSTWLTAYVIRYFLLAKSYITIDDQVISQGLGFLKSQQMPDGRFQEQGRVIDPGMVGEGTSEGVALTAFCLLTFLEAKRGNFTHEKEIIDKGRGFNLKMLNSLNPTQDIYALALATYVELEWDKEMPTLRSFCTHYYHSYCSNKDYFRRLKTIASYDDTSKDLMYWRHDISQRQSNSERIKPMDIETTGYALLVHLRMSTSPHDSFPIVKWLLLRQNPNGGFLSTQDTIVALTAMAKYAELTQVGSTDLNGRASWWLPNSGWSENIFQINETNANYLNEYLVTGGTRDVALDVDGTGTLYAKAVWTYYVEPDLQENDFFLNITKRETGSWYFFLNVCARLRRGRDTNMVIIQARVPSGYVVDTYRLYASLVKVKYFRLYELYWKGTEINIYFDYIPTHPDTCVSIGIWKLYNVRNPARPYVRIYDYYDPHKMSLAYYDPPEVRSWYG